MTESAVIILSFLFVSLILFGSVSRYIKHSLSKYHENIDKQINESNKDLEASKAELLSAIAKNKSIEDVAAEILNAARLRARLAVDKHGKKLQSMLENKIEQEKNRIENRHLIEVQKLKDHVVDVSAHYAYKFMALKIIDKDTQDNVINLAIQKIPKKIH